MTAPSALSDGSHTFRVYAVDNSSNQNKGSITQLNFTIDANAPSVPSGLTPIGGKKTTDSTPLFDWSTSSDGTGSGILSYELKVQSDNLIAIDRLHKPSVISSNYTPTSSEALPIERMKWRVRARDRGPS